MSDKCEVLEGILKHRAQMHRAYVGAYELLPTESTDVRAEIAQQALGEYRSFFDTLNGIVDEEVDDLTRFDEDVAGASAQSYIQIAEATKTRAENLRLFRLDAFKWIGLEIDPELQDDTETIILETVHLTEARQHQRLVETRKLNEPLYNNVVSRLTEILGELTLMEDTIVRTLALHGDTGVEVNRSLIAAFDKNNLDFSDPATSREYASTRSHIIWLLDRSFGDMITVTKQRKSLGHTSGGVLTQSVL